MKAANTNKEVAPPKTQQEAPVILVPLSDQPSQPKNKIAPDHADTLVLGYAKEDPNQIVSISQKELTRHAAFLGGTGCGKTTLALQVLEQLLAQGIPMLLIDRKGDLCALAKPDAWSKEQGDSAGAKRAALLRDQADVLLYTPGHPEGRPLKLPLLPKDIESLSDYDQERLIAHCAAGLVGMMEYPAKGVKVKAALAVLKISLAMLVKKEGPLTLASLADYVADDNDELEEKAAHIKPRIFSELAQNLNILDNDTRCFMEGPGDDLDLDAWFGPSAEEKKAKAIILCTRFLHNQRDVEFWLAQLLMHLVRWSGKAPSDSLRAVLFLDEADRYLPAQGKPATKEPIEDLLKRGRSAGLGLLLATQSPGDLDYKCRDNIRTWLLGRVKEETALKKLKPMLESADAALKALLPAQQPGEFILAQEGVAQALNASPSLCTPIQAPEQEILELAQQCHKACAK